MDPRVYVLGLASFAVGTGTYVYVGLLEPLGADLGVSIQRAGLLATAFAWVYAVAAPVLATWLVRMEPKRIVCGALTTLGVLNAAVFLTSSFAELLVIRILCALGAAALIPTASVYAASMVGARFRGAALAVVLGGISVSLVVGAPLGTLIGAYTGWRGCFGFAAVLLGVAAIASAARLPVRGAFAGPSTRGKLKVSRALVMYWTITVLAFAAAFSVVAFIGPTVTALTGLTGAWVSAFQLALGFGGVAGVALGGVLSDGKSVQRRIRGLCIALGLSQLGLAALSVLPGSPSISIGGTLLGLVGGALCLFSLSPIIQRQLVETAGEHATGALALNGSMVYAGQGLGAALGGLASASGGTGAAAVAGAACALVGALVIRDSMSVPSVE